MLILEKNFNGFLMVNLVTLYLLCKRKSYNHMFKVHFKKYVYKKIAKIPFRPNFIVLRT